MGGDRGNVVGGGLRELAERLHAALGHGGYAALEVHVGHDAQPFVYLRGLSDEQGRSLGDSPQHVLGIEDWLRLVSQLTTVVREERPTDLRRVGDVHVLAF